MKLAALISGGKDSVLAMHLAHAQGHEITAIIAIISENQDSFMFHTPAMNMVELQAKALGIPLVLKKTKGEKEKELTDLKDAIASVKGIDGVVSGAVLSEYQKQRIDVICEELGIKSFAPIWHKNLESIWEEVLGQEFEVIVTGVAADGMGPEWLGRRIDDAALTDLRVLDEKFGVSITGEGGEFETLVLDCPLFSKRIVIEESETQWDGMAGRLVVKKASLQP